MESAREMSGQQKMTLGLLPELEEHRHDGVTPRFKTIQRMAQEAEDAGLDTFWLADHFFYDTPDGPRVGQWEAFTFLSAIASATSRIHLGPMVAATSFRNPALLAKMADSLDEISDGRFILGIGAGWHQPEYDAFGYPFDHRASRFEEALQIIVPLLREGHVDFEGNYYQTREAVLRPRGPSTSGPPIWIGASRPRMLELTARYADAWNCTAKGFRAERIEAEYPKLLEACQKVGRDPATIELTASVEAHLLSTGEQRTADNPEVTGTPEEIAEMLREFANVGVKYLIVISPGGVAVVERFARVIELVHQRS